MFVTFRQPCFFSDPRLRKGNVGRFICVYHFTIYLPIYLVSRVFGSFGVRRFGRKVQDARGVGTIFS